MKYTITITNDAGEVFATHQVDADVAKAVMFNINGRHYGEWADKEENEHHVEAGEEVVMDIITACRNTISGT